MSEDYDTEYDTDYDTDYEMDVIYEPEEPSKTRFNIALCELYNDNIHGSTTIQGQYLVVNRYKKLDIDYIMETADVINNEYRYLQNENHQLFPNYSQIIRNENYIKPEIVECIYMPEDGQCFAIIKTFWIKIIQRAWRNTLKKRLILMKNLATLRQRELTGNRSEFNIIKSRGLRGLLSNFS
jgi:hypothetical protein